MRKNQYEFHDSWFNLIGNQAHNGSFYDVSERRQGVSSSVGLHKDYYYKMLFDLDQ